MTEDETESVIAELKRRHDAGDRLAFVDCLLLCHAERMPPPDWVLFAHVDAWKAYLSGRVVDLKDAFFGMRMDGGRHSDPRRERWERQRYEDAYAAVRAAVMAGQHGEVKFKHAAAIFTARHPQDPKTEDQIEKIFQRQQARVARQPPRFWVIDPTHNAVMSSGELHNVLRRG